MTKPFSYYGASHERAISRNEARKLLTEHVGASAELPRMGYETDIMVLPASFGFKARLSILNISGHFLLASVTDKRDTWLTVFGVQ